MSIEKQKSQLVVLGAGPGGYTAAFRASDLGIQTTLVDVESNPGGVCLYRGCIPSKALLHAAKVISDARSVKELGIEFSKPKIDFEKLTQWKDGVVLKLTQGLGSLVKQRKVNYIQGRGTLADENILRVLPEKGGEIQIQFENLILAPGSHPISVADWPLNSPHLLNSTGGLNLKEIPEKLLVIGGGYIGLELGSVYSELGSYVDLVEMTDGLLPGADRDLVKPLANKVSQIFKNIFFKTKVIKMDEVENGLNVTFENEKGQKEETYNKVLFSVGRKPNSSGLNLQSTEVQIDEKGFIKIDSQMRTHSPNIFAIGDVVGQPMLAHKASFEAKIAVDVISGKNVHFDAKAIPAVVFTDPEIAWAGLTETEAKAKGQKIEVAKFPWQASGRALSMHAVDGLTKLILDPQTEQILGVGLVGTGAGELIAEGVLAIEMGATAEDLALTIHPHPTLSETIMESAEVFYGMSSHMYRPRKNQN